MREYYIFETEKLANDAEKYICDKAGLPWASYRNGKPDETAAKTERWAVPFQRLDSKWCFPVVPLTMLQQRFSDKEIQEIAKDFADKFPHTREIQTQDWFAEEEI